MDFRPLELAVTIAEQRNFARAAAARHMSPSAASRTIGRLEQTLGVRLFERGAKGVRITAAGREFVESAQEILARWQRLRRQLAHRAQALSGELSLYCSVTASYSLLATLLPTFRSRYPAVDIHIHTGDQADAIDRITAGAEDLAIAAKPETLPRQVRFHTLVISPLLFIAPSVACALNDMLAGIDSPAEIPWDRLPLVVSERGLARERLDEWLRGQDPVPEIHAQVGGHEAIVSMVALGLGVGVVPEIVLASSPLRDQVRILDTGGSVSLSPFEVGLCGLQQRLDDPVLAAFWRCAGEGL